MQTKHKIMGKQTTIKTIEIVLLAYLQSDTYCRQWGWKDYKNVSGRWDTKWLCNGSSKIWRTTQASAEVRRNQHRKQLDHRYWYRNIWFMIQNSLFRECLTAIPEERKAEFDLSFAIASRIDEILKLNGMTQRELAQRLGKRESEVSKWLTGRHNFTTNTIARISLALGASIINVVSSSYDKETNTASTMVAEKGVEYGRSWNHETVVNQCIGQSR